jgi:hypothetical protein
VVCVEEHMTVKTIWPAQARQNQVLAEIIVEGTDDWKSLFADKIVVESNYGLLKAGHEYSLLDISEEEARLNDVSIERNILSKLIERGYVLEELEVEFDASDKESWGTCVWYKEHDAYTNPSEKRKAHFPNASPRDLSYIVSMFKTEHMGDQEFTLMSMQMVGALIMRMKDPEGKYPVPFLFHKTIVFKRVVLSTPQAAALAA